MESSNAYSGKKVLITGGLGFLGSNIALALAEAGADVTVLDNFLKLHGANPFNIDPVKKRIRSVKGDIRNAALMKKLIKGRDFLFNIAAQTSHTDSVDHPFLDADINVNGQLNLLETCRAVNREIKIIYCSTRAVYGSSAKPSIDERTIPNPLDIYSVHKLAGEHYHQLYHKVHGLKTVILRVANGYGPRAQMKAPSFGILNWFTRLALDNKEIKIFGDGKQLRDYVYVGDIAQAFLKVGASERFNGEIYNIGSGVGVSLVNIVQEIVTISGKGSIVYVSWPDQNKKIDVGDFVADISKIRGDIGWQPGVKLHDGLKMMVDYYSQHKKHYW